MLTEHYRKHPEMFRCIGASHESNADGQPHITIQVSYEFNARKTGERMTWYRSYHLYYYTEGMKTKYDFITAMDRGDRKYVVAAF